MTNPQEGAERGSPAPEPAAEPAQPQVSAGEAGDPARQSVPTPPPIPPIPPMPVQQAYPGQPYPPQYPAYPGYPGYPMVQRAGTNGFAIAALVCGIVVSPLGIIFGFVALNQIKRTGEEGRGLALAGIWVGAASVAFMVIWLIVFISIFSNVIQNTPGYY
ncbi:MAG TPA: DUF4190 domain-containing protein [Pseudonocardiaceae bacterium]|jgi:hypothetical protein